MTLQELIDLRAAYLKAEQAILTGQNYSIEGLSVSRPDLEMVARRIKELNREILDLQTSQRGGRPGVMTPKWT